MDPIEEIVSANIKVENPINVTHKDGAVSGDYFKEVFKREKILDSREYNTFIKSCEKMIRQSDEYKTFIYKVHNEFGGSGIQSCNILGMVTGEEATLEVDHYPFTLYEICSAVTSKFIREHVPFNTFMVAEVVMKLHFDLKIGFTVLSKTVHQLRHSGKVFIPLSDVAGHFMEFFKEYKEDLEPETLTSFSKLIDMTKKGYKMNRDQSFLTVKHQDIYAPSEIPKVGYNNAEGSVPTD